MRAVLFCDNIADAVREKLRGTELEHLPLIGSLSEVAEFTAISDDPAHRERVKKLYQ